MAIDEPIYVNTSTWDGVPWTGIIYNSAIYELPRHADKVFRGLWVTAKQWLELIKSASAISDIPLVIKPLRLFQKIKRRLQIYQPCWSANRWKSLT